MGQEEEEGQEELIAVPGSGSIPPFLRRRVRAIAAKTGDVSSAFAIATAQAQKAGELRPGTHTTTAKGRRVTRRMAGQPGHTEKIRDYEDRLASDRSEKQERIVHTLDSLRRLGEAALRRQHPKTFDPAQEQRAPAVPDRQDSPPFPTAPSTR